MTTTKQPTKAQLNWEIGKEQENEFIKKLSLANAKGISLSETAELFSLIRGSEYRRGKEVGRTDALKDELEFLENNEHPPKRNGRCIFCDRKKKIIEELK